MTGAAFGAVEAVQRVAQIVRDSTASWNPNEGFETNNHSGCRPQSLFSIREFRSPHWILDSAGPNTGFIGLGARRYGYSDYWRAESI